MALTLPARHVSIPVPIEGAIGVEAALAWARTLAESLRFSEQDIGRVARVVAAAAGNIVRHAGRGEMLLRPLGDPACPGIEVLALDRGPGMANVAAALRAGSSLSDIAGMASCFEISSSPGMGTALMARIGGAAPGQAGSGLEWGVVCVPMRGEEVCGDAYAVIPGPGRDSVLMVDGLGHGPPAFEAALQVLGDFAQHAGAGPADVLKALHLAMRATPSNRGAVASVAQVDWAGRELRYAGAGNISGYLVPLAGRTFNLISHNGTVGQNIARFQEFAYPWPEGGLLILHSDGLSTSWQVDSYPGLARKHPSLIAGVLYRDFASRKDDVVILVGREREPAGTERDASAP